MQSGPKHESDSVIFARAILADRGARRKILFQMLLLLLGACAVGYWPLAGWLEERVLLFALWWCGVAFLTLIILLFAFYDMLKVVQEERQKVVDSLNESLKKGEALIKEKEKTD